MPSAEQLLSARWIIPVEPDSLVLHHHALVIRDGRILETLPADEAGSRYPDASRE